MAWGEMVHGRVNGHGMANFDATGRTGCMRRAVYGHEGSKARSTSMEWRNVAKRKRDSMALQPRCQ